MEASGATLDSTILTGRSKRFFIYLKIQNLSIIARYNCLTKMVMAGPTDGRTDEAAFNIR